MGTGQFDTWYNGAPVFTDLANTGDFGTWYRGAPVLDVGVVAIVLDRLGVLPVEFGARVARDDTLPVEFGTALARLGAVPVEFAGGLVRDGSLPVEFGRHLTLDGQLPVEFGTGVSRLGRVPIESLGALQVAVARSWSLPIEFLLAPVSPAGFWLGGGGAPVWWPVTLYSYYPQQPLWKPTDRPRKHLTPRRRKDRKGRVRRHRDPGLVEQEYAELVHAVARMLTRHMVEPLPPPPSPDIAATILRHRREPVRMAEAERFVQALREDLELLELELL
jgi:hypothetical protein